MYSEHTPTGDLARWVECTWSIDASEAVRGFPVRPDGCMDLWYSPEDGVAVVGAMTRERRYDVSAGTQWVGLRFRPGMARRYLGIDAAELCDCVAPLDEVAGRAGRDLRARLDTAASNDARQRVLLDAVAAGERPADPVHLAIAAMTQAHGEADVDWLADQAGLSARQFRRRCKEEAGLGPKHLARILRFRRACQLAARGESWLRVAMEAGYFDQAHLIRDFREFTGSTPVSVFSKTVPAAVRGGSGARPEGADADSALPAGRASYFDQAHLIRDFREFTGSTPVSIFSKTVPAAVQDGPKHLARILRFHRACQLAGRGESWLRVDRRRCPFFPRPRRVKSVRLGS